MRAAVAQMNSGSDVGANLGRAAALIGEAAAAGAKLVVLPENFAFVGAHEGDKLAHAEATDGSGPILKAIIAAAKKHQIAVIAGGMPERTANPEKVHNACVSIDASGAIGRIYRKLHLFDVVAPDGQEYRESRSVEPGEEIVLAETPLGPTGLTVCYDVRFPELYRRLAELDARAIVVPAAFTKPTGEAHWHVLLRARAIENLLFILAAAQVGTHPNRRETFGHALIIDPWGKVLAECADDREGIAVADLDMRQLEETRAKFPALTHRRI